MKLKISVLMLGVLCAAPVSGGEERIAFTSYGDAPAGRAAFISLKCAGCHRVLGDPSLPAPGGTAAPVLGGLNKEHSTEELSQAVAAPSHSMAPGFEAGVNGASPMMDVSRQMTVRQLIDIVAYLKAAEDTSAPWPKEGP